MKTPVLAAAAAALLALACEKAGTPDTPPTAPPDPVVAVVSTASLGGALAGLRAYAENVRQGSGATLQEALATGALAAATGATALDGLDLAGPLHLVVLDRPTRFVLVGKAADRARLDSGKGAAHLVVRDGWAILGPKDAVESVERWAVPTLAATRPAAGLTASAHVDRLMARHAAEVTAMRDMVTSGLGAADPTGAAMVREYLDGLFALAGDTSRLVATLAVDGERGELDLALQPRAGSRLAAWIAAQKPGDFDLLGSLPAGAPTGMLMAGHIELGPFRDQALALFARMMNLEPGAGVDYARAFAALADLATGDVAAGFNMGPTGTSMVEIVPVRDAAAAEKVVREIAVATAAGVQVTSMGIRSTHTGRADLAVHQGAVIHGMTTTIDLDSAPPQQREILARMYGDRGQEMQIAFPERALIATIGDLALTRQAIDAHRGKAARLTLSPSAAAFAAAARARKDSLLMVMDLPAMMSSFRAMAMPGVPPPAPSAAPGLAISLGFADRAAHLRFTLLADTIKALIP